MQRTKIISVLILLVSILLLNDCGRKQNTQISEINKYAAACRVWGALKYYHPVAGSGRLNWDNDFIQLIKQLDTIHTKREINSVIKSFFVKLDSLQSLEYKTNKTKDDVFKSNTYNWFNDTSILSSANSIYLKGLIDSNYNFNRYYISGNPDIATPEFNNEIAYKDSLFPSRNLRLLALSRFWNAINYFYPHLELNDVPWDSVLNRYIPKIINADDTISYHLTVLELTSQLNDGHIWTESVPLILHFGIYSAPYRLSYIENQVVFSEFFTDSISSLYDIRIGDILKKINNRDINEIIKSRLPYYSYSNEDHFMRRILEDLLASPSKDTLYLTIERSGEILIYPIKPHLLYELWEIQDFEYKSKSKYHFINESTAYLNLKYLEKNDVDRILPLLIKMKKLIIDIRNYPNGVIYLVSNYLNIDSLDFVKIFAPSTIKPGSFYYTVTLKTGKSTKERFTGEIILLVNEKTQSHAEFTAMCFQASNNVTTIGSTTAGTDGNVAIINLPGGISTMFTGLGVEYPDGTQTQRCGIKIDQYIKPTIKDLQIGRDPLLELALDL